MAGKNDAKIVDFETLMNNQDILTGCVVSCEDTRLSDKNGKKILYVNYKGKVVAIEEKEISFTTYNFDISKLVGEQVEFTIKAIGNDLERDYIFGSMKDAINIKNKPIIDRLERGEVMSSVIVKRLDYGSYVCIEGKINGIIKNHDYSDDGSSIKDDYMDGNEIKVKFKKYTENGTLCLEAAEKKHGKALFKPEDVTPGRTFIGIVTKVETAGDYLTVKVGPQIQIGCIFPKKYPLITEGANVVVKITKIVENKERNRTYYKGKITNVITDLLPNY